MTSATQWIGPVVFVGSGAVTVAFAIHQLRAAFATKSWPLAEGVILGSRMTTRRVTTESGTDDQRVARITYSYQVGDKTYQGNRVVPGIFGVLSQRRVRARYQKKAPCRVAYDPANPRRAVLEPGPTFFQWYFLGAGALFGGLGVLWGWLASHQG